MDVKWPSSTNKGTALLRHMHQFEPNRIVQDDYISWFFDESTTANLRKTMPSKGEDRKDPAQEFIRIVYRFGALREKYIDDVIESSIELGCRQLLLLGSGYDTRFFRLPSIRKHSVATFEVDLPETIRDKMTILKKRLGSFPPGLSFISLDFNDKDWSGIARGGFQAAIPTVYVWQGVSYYLPEDTVSSVLDFIRSEMAAGSVVAFDCCWPLMLIENDEIPGIRYHIERLKQIDEPYIFAMDPNDMESWLMEKGFQHISVAMQDDLEMTYMHTRTLPKKMWYVVTAA